MRTTIYVHGSKESNWTKGVELGLDGDALMMFSHACEEVALEIEVDKATGIAKIVGVDGRLVYE